MAANQTLYSRLEQRYVIEPLVAEKCKPCEIYLRMCDMYGEGCFWQKMFTNGLNMSLPLSALVKKRWFSGKEKVLSTVISK